MEPLVDQFGRVHSNLRVSVTDRCNIRCFYCMPDENIRFRPREELLTFEEILRFVRVVATAGIRKVRLTGGEPLLRADLATLIRGLRRIDQIDDVALTTNGILLPEQATTLRDAGLDRLNISLDTLREETFEKIARRPGLDRVLSGIDAALEAGFTRIRLNAIAMKDLTEAEVLPLVGFARSHGLEIRFIEFMPLDAEENWSEANVLTGAAIKHRIAQEFGELVPVAGQDSSQPAVDYKFLDGSGRVGFINSVTEPFCHSCNRLRITSEGQVRNCLFSNREWDARALIRGNASDAQLLQLVRDCLWLKKRGHGRDDLNFLRPDKAMYQIGG